MRAKNVLALALAVSLGAVWALAQSKANETTSGKGYSKTGTIVSLDNSTRTATIKVTDANGNARAGVDAELKVRWDDSTKIEGALKEGELVRFRTTEKDGKTVATWIHVGKLDM